MKKFLLMFILLIPSCAPWMEAGGPYGSLSHNFSVDIPEGWMRLDTERYLLISKDGPFLQYVLIQDRPVGRAFRHTKKKLNTHMLPQEAADLILDEIISDQNISGFKLIENVPIQLQQHDGFRLIFTYRDQDGLKLKTIYYGFLAGETFYNMRFTAAEKYYFEKDIGAFQEVLCSFKLIEPLGKGNTAAAYNERAPVTDRP